MAAERSSARVFHFHRGENRLFHFFGAGGGKGLFRVAATKIRKKGIFFLGGGFFSPFVAKAKGGFPSDRGQSHHAEKGGAKKDTSDLTQTHTHM